MTIINDNGLKILVIDPELSMENPFFPFRERVWISKEDAEKELPEN